MEPGSFGPPALGTYNVPSLNDRVDFLESDILQIMATQAQLAADLTAIAAQVTKTRNETLAKITALEAAIIAAGNTSPAVDSALAALKGTVQTSDDVIPDPTP